MRWWNFTVVVVPVVVMVVVLAVHEGEAANILFLAPYGTESHKNFFMGIAEALTTRNHTVKYVTTRSSSKTRPNIEEVYVPEVDDLLSRFYNPFTTSFSSTFLTLLPLMHEYCGKALHTKEIQTLEEEKFDLVFMSVFMTECFYPFVDKLKVPYIHMIQNVLPESLSDIAGNPQFPSMVPNFMLDLGYPLTFTGRIINIFSDFISYAIVNYFILPRMAVVSNVDVDKLRALRHNASLLVVNSVMTLEVPARAYVPTVVHAGGIHCRPAQPLPHELEEWVSGAGDAGFIYFSLGSAIQGSVMPDKYRMVLVEVFASLEQRVLWKWETETMEDLPSNVRLAKWLPQQDILGDPRLRLFITHGGLLSTQEATYHGVPILGIPVIADQQHNMRNSQKEGWARTLTWDDLSYDLLRQNILLIINDTKLRQESERRSAVMRDQPMTPSDWTVYWTEYVIRHRGAPHLRSPFFTMPWYEVYNVDVWLLLTVVIVLITCLFCWIVHTVVSRFCFPSAKHKQE